MMLAGLTSCEQVDNAVVEQIDSLNVRAYDIRYSSLKEARKCTDEILTKYSDCAYKDGIHEALINRGFVYFMQMRYDSVRVCCNTVLKESRNDLLCSMADISMMLVCNMTGLSKEFYDYRSDAQERLTKVAGEEEAMTEHQHKLWISAQTQYHLASIRYFIRMRLSDNVNESDEWLDENRDKFSNDSTLLASYMMLKSMVSLRNGDAAEALIMQRRNLLLLLQSSINHDYTFMKAEAMNRLGRSIVRSGELTNTQAAFVRQLLRLDDEVELGPYLAEQSLKLFEKYGNKYTISRGLVLLSEYKHRDEKFDEALSLLKRALQLINMQHKELNVHHNHEKAVRKDQLYVFSDDEDTLSTEMEWIADPDIVAVPDWMASVREQLSIVFGAMGMKAESDYNHNLYFDILDATRQDQRVIQEEDNLNREERSLKLLIHIFVAVIILLGWILYLVNKRSDLLYQKRVKMLSEVIEVCKNMTQALSEDTEDEESLLASLHELTDKDVLQLFPSIAGSEDWTKASLKGMSGMDKEMFNVLIVFFDWIKEKGMMYIAFADEERRLESETYMLEKRFEDSKRQYLEKLTSMSIVNGITPFLDRALREVAKLKSGDDGRAKERFEYVSELIDKINEYNDVLGHWVKIRKGLVSLNIENFELHPLLETLKLGAKTFENKGIKLNVADSDCVVKADKSLTLFMMNTLLDNARKYTPEGGTVILSTTQGDDYVEISVQDTGHGMSEEDVATLNNTKVYDSSKIGVTGEHAEEVKKHKGFGFGLMNCKGIIEKYRKTNAMFSVCQFGVESEVGKGSRFYFRLPKGVMKALTIMMLFMIPVTSCKEPERPDRVDVLSSSINKHEVFDDPLLDDAEYFTDCVFSENVNGNYEQALVYADSAISKLNAYYLKKNPGGDKLMHLEGGGMAEVDLWRDGFKTNYELIIGIRNEVAISALSLNRTRLYRYNSEVFTRLCKLASTDNAMEEYCNSIRSANKNRKATAIILGIVLFLMVVVYFFIHYRRYQLFIFNLRQLIELNKKVFTASDDKFREVLHEALSDIKLTDRVELAFDKPTLAEKMEMKAWNENLRAYPLTVKTADENVDVGVMTVMFHDKKLTADEELIIDLVSQFVAIHTYFTHMKVGERNTLIELKEDERRRVEAEQQRVYVQNMIMDNCMSTLKHETMYYPNRIKQITDSALGSDVNEKIADVDELLSYYKEVFTVLSTCAGKQVERVLFKRSIMPVSMIGEMIAKVHKKMGKKQQMPGKLTIDRAPGLKVVVDRVFIQTLIENVLSLYFEHASGGDLNVRFEEYDGFVKFIFSDSEYRYPEDLIPKLFYVDNVKYDAKNDRLVGMQYLLAKQIIREHDQYSNKRGCRIYVENDDSGYGSRFIYTLQKA